MHPRNRCSDSFSLCFLFATLASVSHWCYTSYSPSNRVTAAFSTTWKPSFPVFGGKVQPDRSPFIYPVCLGSHLPGKWGSCFMQHLHQVPAGSSPPPNVGPGWHQLGWKCHLPTAPCDWNRRTGRIPHGTVCLFISILNKLRSKKSLFQKSQEQRPKKPQELSHQSRIRVKHPEGGSFQRWVQWTCLGLKAEPA